MVAMNNKRRTYTRRVGNRRYRKLFIISTEGTNTERQYFSMFNNKAATIRVKCLKSKSGGTAPEHVLKRIKKHLKDERLQKTDEAWIVVDKDDWSEVQLKTLFDWSTTGPKYNLALNNPQFEYWLLLHFEDGFKVSTSPECMDRIRKYLPSYDKNLDCRKLTMCMIQAAIKRAKQRDSPPCTDWPRSPGSTTVYRLVEGILNAGKENG